MIDEKTLADEESRLRRLTDHYKKDQAVLENMSARIEIIRLARRYLALRESRNFSPGVFGDEWGLRMTGARLTESERIQLDASADRLLEG